MTDPKLTHLREIVAGLGSLAVAYSGGTDSSYLLAVCLDVLRHDRIMALTADSPLTTRTDMVDARAWPSCRIASLLSRRYGPLAIVMSP